MPRTKAPSKKQQKRGIDFKKIKRKIGKRLPPPKNATNTEIKSKAIILPEQSVASEKEGLAVNKKGLTLKELLQQTSHHNAKVRKDALLGVKDLFLKHPAELSLHKYAVIEKLRERIADNDKLVREILYQLLKSVIFPGCKEDNQGILISLLMAYIFIAMANLAIEVRLMAFKIFDLVVQHYSHTFFLHAEKILQSYEDILRKNECYLQNKDKLKIILSGLHRCLSMLPCNKREVDSSIKDLGHRVLHAFEINMPTNCAGFSVIIPKLNDLLPILLNCFQELISAVQNVPSLDAQSFDCMLSILHSVDLSVSFFVYVNDEGRLEIPPSEEGFFDATMRPETISTILLKKFLVLFPLNPDHQFSEKIDERYFTFNAIIAKIIFHLRQWIQPPEALLERVLEFVESALLGKDEVFKSLCRVCINDWEKIKISTSTRSGKSMQEKHLISLLPFIPKLISQLECDWKFRLLQAFTMAFKDCNPESSLKLACLAAIGDMLIPTEDMLYLDASISEILDHQIAWIREFPLLLMLLGDKHTSSSQVVLHLQLKLGQLASSNSSLAWEYDNMQYSLQQFYSTLQDDGSTCYGPFIRLPIDSQELSICSLYYFSYLDPLFLKSITYCCLCPDLEPLVLFRIIEVLHSAYKVGRIQIADLFSFFITLLSSFRVFPESIHPIMESEVETSNRRQTLKSATNAVCSCISQMGDKSLVLQLLEDVIFSQISLKSPLDNSCAMLRMLIALDSKPTRLSQRSITTLGSFLSGYLIDIMHYIPRDEEKESIWASTCRYYLIPCFFLFDRSHKLLNLVLKMLGSLVTMSGSSQSCQLVTDISITIDAVVSVLQLMHKDKKFRLILPSYKTDIDCILQKVSCLQASSEINITFEEKQKIQCAFDRLRILTSILDSKMQKM